MNPTCWTFKTEPFDIEVLGQMKIRHFNGRKQNRDNSKIRTLQFIFKSADKFDLNV